MAHAERKKKDGQRKDKKMERMREAIAERRMEAGPLKPTHDQEDIQTFKPGSKGDTTVQSRHRPNYG